MKFNKFILNNYLETSEGREVLQFFRDLPQIISTHDHNNIITKFIDNSLFIPLANEWYEFNYPFHPTIYKNFNEFYEDTVSIFEGEYLKIGLTPRDILQDIPHLSLYFYARSQQFAFPYLFPVHFHYLQDICDILEIPLPSFPKKTQYYNKCLYYIELCKVFYEFRLSHELNPYEFCALIYGFSKHLIKPYTIESLPTPLKVFITGANSKVDHPYLQTISHNSVHYWQGNIDTEIGDIVLMYELAPHSCISSIWRAITPGYDDPFRYYPGVIWVGNPIIIPPISINELKENSVWSQKGLVKANMQGVSGTPCSREEYAALLSILKNKNFDVSLLPTLPRSSSPLQFSLTNERDVEQYLLEPFLKKLDLAENNWIRQMPLRMGRGYRYYPDYVINPETERGNERGDIICEAKYRIQSKKQLKEDFDQAKSYARRLDSQALILASYEGIWLSFAHNNFEFEKIEFYDWYSLDNSDIFYTVKIKLEKLYKQNRKKIKGHD